jgi:hypothetical protein
MNNARMTTRRLAHGVALCASLLAGCDLSNLFAPATTIEGRVVHRVGGAPIEGIYVELFRDPCEPSQNCSAVDEAVTDVAGHFEVWDRFRGASDVHVLVNTPRIGRPDSLYRRELGSAARSFASEQRHTAWFLLETLDP